MPGLPEPWAAGSALPRGSPTVVGLATWWQADMQVSADLPPTCRVETQRINTWQMKISAANNFR